LPTDVDASDLNLHAVQAARYLSRITPALKQSGAVVLGYCGSEWSRSTKAWCETVKRAHEQYMKGNYDVPVLHFDHIEVMKKKFEAVRKQYDLPAPGHGFHGFVVEQYTRLMIAARCRVTELVMAALALEESR
jgi:hypothetical protein